MLLSINYSLQAAQLCRQKRLKIDFFKCPEWTDMITEAKQLRPVCVHFSLKAGRGKLKDVDWDFLAEVLQQTQTPYINLHLEAKTKDFPDIPVDSTDPIHQEQVFEQMLSDLNEAVKRFGAQKVIAENVPYRSCAGKVLRPAVEAQVIRQLLRESGCGLLLDISHARMTALDLGLDERQYISELPVDSLRELHFTGVHQFDGCYQDHLPALEADWQLLDWVFERIYKGEWAQPWMLAFEYGGVGERFADRSEARVIETQIPILQRKIDQNFN